MAKKKKKKGRRPKQSSSSKRAAPKKASGQDSPQARVFKHMAVLLIVAAACFYVLLRHSIGGAAYWKVVLLVLGPFAYLAARKQFFQAPRLWEHLRPTLFRVSTAIAVFVATNGICYLLLRYALLGKREGDPTASISGILIFLLSPNFAFGMQANPTELTSLIVLGVFSLFYSYGLVILGHFEFHHGMQK